MCEQSFSMWLQVPAWNRLQLRTCLPRTTNTIDFISCLKNVHFLSVNVFKLNQYTDVVLIAFSKMDYKFAILTLLSQSPTKYVVNPVEKNSRTVLVRKMFFACSGFIYSTLLIIAIVLLSLFPFCSKAFVWKKKSGGLFCISCFYPFAIGILSTITVPLRAINFGGGRYTTCILVQSRWRKYERNLLSLATIRMLQESQQKK